MHNLGAAREVMCEKYPMIHLVFHNWFHGMLNIKRLCANKYAVSHICNMYQFNIDIIASENAIVFHFQEEVLNSP